MPVPTVDTSGIVDATIASASKWLTPYNNLKNFIADLTAGNAGAPVERLLWGTQSVQISGTTISAITKKYVIVDTDGSATQFLDTISGPVQGHEVILEMANAARVVTLRTGTGNVTLWGSANVTLAVGKALHLFRTSTGWSDVFIPVTAYSQENIIPNSSFEVWERGNATAPDNWTLTGSGATIAQESSTIYHGAYSAKITRVGNDVTFVTDIYNRFGKTYPRSKQITFSMWVFSATASIARLRIDDGVTVTQSAYHPGTSAWVKLSVTATLGAAITTAKVGLEVNTTNGIAYADAAMVSEGPNVNNYTPDSLPFNRFPRQASVFGRVLRQPVGTAGITRTFQASQSFGLYYNQTTPAQNDEFSFNVFLEAGTYTLSCLGLTANNAGITTWKVDNVAQGTTHDWYTAGTVYDVTKTLTITVVGDGYHVIKGVMASKNGSSASYIWYVTMIDIFPAAD